MASATDRKLHQGIKALLSQRFKAAPLNVRLSSMHALAEELDVAYLTVNNVMKELEWESGVRGQESGISPPEFGISHDPIIALLECGGLPPLCLAAEPLEPGTPFTASAADAPRQAKAATGRRTPRGVVDPELRS